MLSDLQQKEIIPLYFNTESEKVFNLIGEQRDSNQKWDTMFHILSWLKQTNP